MQLDTWTKLFVNSIAPCLLYSIINNILSVVPFSLQLLNMFFSSESIENTYQWSNFKFVFPFEVSSYSISYHLDELIILYLIMREKKCDFLREDKWGPSHCWFMSKNRFGLIDFPSMYLLNKFYTQTNGHIFFLI